MSLLPEVFVSCRCSPATAPPLPCFCPGWTPTPAASCWRSTSTAQVRVFLHSFLSGVAWCFAHLCSEFTCCIKSWRQSPHADAASTVCPCLLDANSCRPSSAPSHLESQLCKASCGTSLPSTSGAWSWAKCWPSRCVQSRRCAIFQLGICIILFFLCVKSLHI